jgi:hypothetical protein
MTSGELVKMLRPYPVTNMVIPATGRTTTTITMTWTASKSSDVISYNVYRGAVLLGNTTSLTYTATALTANTSYTLKVKALDSTSNESDAVSITTKTKDIYRLQQVRTSRNYVEIPLVTFTAIELVCEVTPINDWGNSIIYLINNVGTSLYGEFSGTNWTCVGLFAELYVNGVKQTNLNNVAGMIPINQKCTLKVTVSGQVTDKINIFANVTNGATMQGYIHEVRLYNNTAWQDEILTSVYDFSYTASGTVLDSLNKNPAVILHGGTFTT